MYAPLHSWTPLFELPVDATVTTTVEASAGCD
jgi:hypothetical protein